MLETGGTTGFRIEPLAWASKVQSKTRKRGRTDSFEDSEAHNLEGSPVIVSCANRPMHLVNRFLRLDRLF